MKMLLQEQEFLSQVNTVVCPPTQFKDLEPELPSLYFIAQLVNFSEDPLEKMDEIMTFLAEIILPQSI